MLDKISWMIAELEYDGFDVGRKQVKDILSGETEAYEPALIDYVMELNDEYPAD